MGEFVDVSANYRTSLSFDPTGTQKSEIMLSVAQQFLIATEFLHIH
jgi:hypothetical protein